MREGGEEQGLRTRLCSQREAPPESLHEEYLGDAPENLRGQTEGAARTGHAAQREKGGGAGAGCIEGDEALELAGDAEVGRALGGGGGGGAHEEVDEDRVQRPHHVGEVREACDARVGPWSGLFAGPQCRDRTSERLDRQASCAQNDVEDRRHPQLKWPKYAPDLLVVG